MTKLVTILGVLAAGGVMAAASGCSDDDTETSTSAATTGNPGSTTTTTGTGGTGGSGGSATGGGTSVGGSGGSGGGPACVNCIDFLLDYPNTPATDLCGYVSGDPMTGDLMCDADSSCSKYSDFSECTCVTTCADACGDSACMGMPPSADCITCSDSQCAESEGACATDMGR